MTCGWVPAPQREFTENRFHYNWHWFWDYGNGDIGNQGIHEMDIARWGTGCQRIPSASARWAATSCFDDDQETPNTMVSTFEFNDGGKKKILTFETRHWMSNHEAGIGDGGTRKDPNTIGNVWYGSKGYLAVDGYNKYTTFLGKDQQPGPSRDQGGNNWQNFIDVVRSRKKEEQNNPIEEGAISVVLMHLANISYRVGSGDRVRFDEDADCRGCGSEQAVDSQLPQGLRGAEAGVAFGRGGSHRAPPGNPGKPGGQRGSEGGFFSRKPGVRGDQRGVFSRKPGVRGDQRGGFSPGNPGQRGSEGVFLPETRGQRGSEGGFSPGNPGSEGIRGGGFWGGL